MLRNQIIQTAAAMQTELTALRRHIHAHPELGTQEFETQAFIRAFLEAEGIPCREIADTGLVALIEGRPGGRCVALRADIDALPILEKNDVPYRSQNDGVMHACGHDLHTAINMGCAKLLNGLRDSFTGSVKLLFQPAEESVGGAKRMVAQGALENPTVDAVLGLHVSSGLDYNQIEARHGSVNASTNEIVLTVKGKKGHGAYPDKCIDAIVIAAHVVTSLQSVVSRNLSPLDSAVLTVGTIHGGTANNIIADEVVLRCTLRTPTPEIKAMMIERVTALATGVAAAMGGVCEVEVKEGYISLINDSRVLDRVIAQAELLLGADNVRMKPAMSMGGEDFSFFCEAVPGAFYNLGCRLQDRAEPYIGHSNNYDADERCLVTGVTLECLTALDLLEKPL